MKTNYKSKLRTCLLTWLGLYPTILIVSFLMRDFLSPLPNYQRTFVLTIIVVPMMIFWVMPAVNWLWRRVFGLSS